MKDINKRLEVLEETMAKVQDVIDDIRTEIGAADDVVKVGDVVRLKGHDQIFVVTYVGGDYVVGFVKTGEVVRASIDQIVPLHWRIYLVNDILALLKEGEE